MRALHVRRLGLIEYEDGLRAQRLLSEARAADLIPDTLLLLEHPRVVTLGRGAQAANILWTEQTLRARGFEVFETDRGGDVTYHGPGQLVGYPILDLKPDRKDVRKYVASLEEVMIRTAGDFGIESGRTSGRIGTWTAAGKLGAIGVHLSHWITSHGFAFNVSTDLHDFEAIVPCGISDAGVTSLEMLLGSAPPMGEVEERIGANAAAVWEAEPFEVPPELETVSIAVLRGADAPAPVGGANLEILLARRIPERGGFWQILTGRREPGEPAHAAAARELYEETGFSPRLEEVRDLGYVHSFALDPSLGRRRGADEPTAQAQAVDRRPTGPPRGGPESRAQVSGHRPMFARETAFAVRVPDGSVAHLDPGEHDAHDWVDIDEALRRLPFAGLRRTVRLAVAQCGQGAG